MVVGGCRSFLLLVSTVFEYIAPPMMTASVTLLQLQCKKY